MIPSPSPSVKIQIIGKEVTRQNIAGWCQQIFCFKILLTMPSNVLPSHLKQTFPPMVWIFIEGEEIESRLPFKIFSTLAWPFDIYIGQVAVIPTLKGHFSSQLTKWLLFIHSLGLIKIYVDKTGLINIYKSNNRRYK